MNPLRFAAGILLLLLSLLLSIATLSSAFKAIIATRRHVAEDNTFGLGYGVGSAVFVCVMLVAIFFIARWGLRLMKRERERG